LVVVVPATVSVAGGQTTASFQIQASALGVFQPLTATITAGAGGVTKSAQLTVKP